MVATKQTGAIEVVRDFLAALERLDVDAAGDLLADDVVYQNVPFPPARGRREVLAQLEAFGRVASAFGVEHHNIAADGAIVLTERTDTVGMGPVRASFWVCGTFEVHDGRITLWRDRFDFVDVTWGLVRGVARAAASRLGR